MASLIPHKTIVVLKELIKTLKICYVFGCNIKKRSSNLWRIGPFILGLRQHHTKLSLAAKLSGSHNIFPISRCFTRYSDWGTTGKGNRKHSNTRRNRSPYEREPIAQKTDEIVVHNGRNQSGSEDTVIPEASIPATCLFCVYLLC